MTTRVVIYGVLVLSAIVYVMPLVVMVMTSLKPLIRPEAVNDKEGVDRGAKSVATFEARVEIVEPAGSDTFVVTRAAGKELTARVRADTEVRIGENHTFAFNLDKAVLFDPQTSRGI